VWRRLRWPTVERITGAVDIVHSTDLVPPPTHANLVVSVHDVLPATHPHFYSSRAQREHRAKLREIHRAAIVVTCTAAAADEVANVTGVDRDRIVVAPLGGRPQRLLERPPAATPFVLAVGVVTPRKGFEALARVVDAIGDHGPTVVIAGPDGYRADEVHAALGSAVARGRIRLVGAVSDEDLDALYRDALLLCHPSLAEGFGLVCLEAMQAGVPVVATDIAAVREVVGDAALLVPPADSRALADAVAALVDDETGRATMRRAGLRRAALFDWDQTAAKVVDGYRRALEATE
jgi:glycosyltransferase involved in cell wall biosynthesis